jgi:L-seryl-tRNA(Ser) seleniumtransferase
VRARGHAADRRRRLPAVHRVMAAEPLAGAAHRWGAEAVAEAAAEAVQEVRDALAQGRDVPPEALQPAELARRALSRLQERSRPSLRRVINATGVVLHTNLGRAVLAEAARAAVQQAAATYTNLEVDLETGERGSRYQHVAERIRRLTGAEAALVVNNNAAAVLLVLAALAAGRSVVVSRGELVEIGGSFRIPDVMAQSGARLVEVGTTNRTRAADYRAAVGPDTAALLKVHRSNFRLVGFVAEATLEELVALGRETSLPVVYDLGSGTLVDLEPFGLPGEPTVQSAVAAGADVVTFSGDKLLGGPQAGIICGRAAWVERCRRHPLNRALRVDKLTLAALEATLRCYERPGEALRAVPTLAMLARPSEELRVAAERLAAAAAAALAGRAEVSVLGGASQAGGGSLPAVELPTWLVAVGPTRRSAAEALARLRTGEPPVVARVQGDRLLLDPRTLLPGDDEDLVAALAAAV